MGGRRIFSTQLPGSNINHASDTHPRSGCISPLREERYNQQPHNVYLECSNIWRNKYPSFSQQSGPKGREGQWSHSAASHWQIGASSQMVISALNYILIFFPSGPYCHRLQRLLPVTQMACSFCEQGTFGCLVRCLRTVWEVGSKAEWPQNPKAA